MNDKRKALGRGLDALLPSSQALRPTAPPAPAPTITRESGAQEIALELIDRNPFQTRGRVTEESLEELAASIRVSGVVQPIVVRPIANGRYQLMAGERRWLASQRAGKQTIPAVVRQASDAQAMEITIVENLQREDLNPMEQARAYERLSREFGLTQEQMAQRTGKDRASVANFLRLLRLPPEGMVAIEEGKLSFGHGKVLMMLANTPMETQIKTVERVLERELSVRQTEELVHTIIGPHEPKQEEKAKTKDPNVKAAETSIQRALGCKVEITDRGGKGKIVLQYASLEDFDRIVEALGAQ
jgi:ParB family transcriptional regulator, chromosome partitioning protein